MEESDCVCSVIPEKVRERNLQLLVKSRKTYGNVFGNMKRELDWKATPQVMIIKKVMLSYFLNLKKYANSAIWS